MATEPDYVCSRCHKPTERDLLTAKKAVFLEMGERARTLKSRVTEWLCPPCVQADVDWNRPKYTTPFTAAPHVEALPKREALIG